MKRNREEDNMNRPVKIKKNKKSEDYCSKLRSNNKQAKLESRGDDNDDEVEWETEEEIELDYLPPDFNREAQELTDPRLKQEYEHIKDYIAKTRREISLKDILEADHLTTEEKAEIMEFYQLLCMGDADSEELDRIKKLIRSAVLEGKTDYISPADSKRLSAEEIEVIKNTKERLKNLNNHLRQELSLKIQILLSSHTDTYKKILLEKLERTDEMMKEDPEYGREMDVIKLCLSLPVGIKKQICTNPNEFPLVLRRVHENLNNQIGGMNRTKQQILEILASRFTNPNRKGDITALIGDAGVGKTRLVLSLSEALGIPVEIIPLGGIKDKSVLTGFSSTYVGAQSGRILQAIKRMGCDNGIILFDEFEKLGDSHSNEVSSCLINILDPTQNHRFQDEYLQGIEIDISNIWFWASANSVEPINQILRNRINFIYVPTPSEEEKKKVFEKYIFPETLKNVGLNSDEVCLHLDTAQWIIRKATLLFDKEETKGYRKIIEILEVILKKINLIKHYNMSSGDVLPEEDYPQISLPVDLKPELLQKLIKDKDFQDEFQIRLREKFMYS